MQPNLHTLLTRRNLRALPRALAAGANPNALDAHGSTPLLTAIEHELPLHIIDALLAAGANPNTHDHEATTAMHTAARWHADARVITHLLQAGAHPHTRDHAGHAPIDLATEMRNTAAFTQLLAHGVPFDECPLDGWRPVDRAVAVDAHAIVNLLLDAGVDATTTTPDGDTPLHLLGMRRSPVDDPERARTTQRLLMHGVNPHARNILGVTPLHAAVRNGAGAATVRVLLHAGANPNSVDNLGDSPTKAARRWGDRRVTHLLQGGA